MSRSTTIRDLPTLESGATSADGGVEISIALTPPEGRPIYLRAGQRVLRNGVYLTRNETRQVIEALQEKLEKVGPKPIIEPEGVDHYVDVAGRYWVKNEAVGRFYGNEPALREAKLAAQFYAGNSLPFDALARSCGPLTPVRVEKLPAIEVPA